MNFKDTGCCAIQEITGLSTHLKAEDAMVAFCKANINGGRPKFGSFSAAPDSVYSFYLFTAAVWHSKTKLDQYNVQYYRPYGAEFAKFIEDNDLGKVVASSIEVNQAFHKDHSNQVWIWTPNKANLKKWWEEYKKTHTVEATAPVPSKTMAQGTITLAGDHAVVLNCGQGVKNG